MGTNNGNRPKLEPELNQEVRVRLLKEKPFTGENGYGKYYLYSVANAENGEELAFFAPQEVHDIIVEKGLTKGSEFIVRKIPYQNGNKKITSKLELSLVNSAAPAQPTAQSTDGLRDLMLQCVQDAAFVVANSGVQFSNGEVQKFATTLFIARSKAL